MKTLNIKILFFIFICSALNAQAMDCGIYLLRGILIENPEKKDYYYLVTDANSNSEKKWIVTPSRNLQKPLGYFLNFMVLLKLNVSKSTSFSGEIDEIKWTTPTILPYDDDEIISIQLQKKAACEK